MYTEDTLAERIVRFMNLVPYNEDKTLIILKGHLLIEELITELLKTKLKNDNPLEIKVTPSMMFARKLNLCWALIRTDIKIDIWGHLKELNSIRNKMAHSIEPKGINDKIEQFTKTISQHEGFKVPKTTGNDLVLSLGWLYAILAYQLHVETNS